MIKIGIIGGTGYTGVELLRLLAAHPQADLRVITSRSEAGKKVAELFSNLRGHVHLAFSEPDPKTLAGCDVVFSATPNGVAMTHARELLKAGVKFIDLAADFRLKDAATWEKWYGTPHACPELLAEAVYGLPEVNREKIKQARPVAIRRPCSWDFSRCWKNTRWIRSTWWRMPNPVSAVRAGKRRRICCFPRRQIR
jgi:N-acetyl-gamma-glutamyl-phosphate reductase